MEYSPASMKRGGAPRLRAFRLIMRANNDNRPKALLAIVDAAAAERVVRFASPVVQEK